MYEVTHVYCNGNFEHPVAKYEGNALDEVYNLTKEIERLREALQLIIDHPVAASGQWFVGVKEIKNVARAALEGK